MCMHASATQLAHDLTHKCSFSVKTNVFTTCNAAMLWILSGLVIVKVCTSVVQDQQNMLVHTYVL